MEAYFDNSATTKVLDSVRDIVVKTMTEDYGNPAAKHRKGMEAEQYIRDARKIIADTMKVQEKEILFTSGGSESNNMALIGTAWARLKERSLTAKRARQAHRRSSASALRACAARCFCMRWRIKVFTFLPVPHVPPIIRVSAEP